MGKKEPLLIIQSEAVGSGNLLSYLIKPVNPRKSNIPSMGVSIFITSSITGNCQLGAIQKAYRLTYLSIAEFKEFISAIHIASYLRSPHRGVKIFGKSSLLIDVTNPNVDKLRTRFKRSGAYERLNTRYTNRTGSRMTMMIMDLRGE